MKNPVTYQLPLKARGQSLGTRSAASLGIDAGPTREDAVAYLMAIAKKAPMPDCYKNLYKSEWTWWHVLMVYGFLGWLIVWAWPVLEGVL